MVLKTYYDFSNPGSYGGLERLHKATGVPVKKLKIIMWKNLIYSLHKPVRIRYARNPITMYNDGKVWKKFYSKKLFGTSRKSRKPTLKAGDKVMFSKVRRTFKKGYLPGWTEEIFIVDRVLNTYVPSYKIKEYDGTPVKGTFYEEESKKSRYG